MRRKAVLDREMGPRLNTSGSCLIEQPEMPDRLLRGWGHRHVPASTYTHEVWLKNLSATIYINKNMYMTRHVSGIFMFR